MAITTRQNSLLVSEDWTKIYQTFKEADFQSYDFETLRKSMIDYLRLYYPEDFNDFIESSEYIALIDLIAFLGQGLAFRGDLNARENFIDTAERRESILKLAKLINYTPKRNLGASGLLKITGIRTTEPVFDSDGINLSGLPINWNDRNNPSWQEQYITIINSALTSSQRVGKSGNTTVINGITNSEYELNLATTKSSPVFPFTTTVDGYGLPFEIVGVSTIGAENIYETSPKPSGAINILSRNDKLGNNSNNTGFFLYFKQGKLQNQKFTINEAIPNRTISVNVSGINNTDIWLYKLDSNGSPYEKWTQVPTISGSNIAYNSLSNVNRKLYQVVSKSNDQIDILFGDGVFAEIPKGDFIVYFRTSAGLNYKITPDEMQGINVSINYTSKRGRTETLTFIGDLQYTVTNASARETLDEIKQKAPQQYYTQNRIVTGEDYNIFPFTAFSNVVKVKSVNRTSSGISRYLDVIDSTGKYSSTNIYGQDGWLYQDETLESFTFTFSNSNDILRIIRDDVNGLLSSKEFLNFYYEKYTKFTFPDLFWNQSTVGTNLTSGYFIDAGDNPQQLGSYVVDNKQYIRPGSLIKLDAPAGKYFDASNYLRDGAPTKVGDTLSFYTSVKTVVTDGTNQGLGNLADGTGSVILNDIVPTGAVISEIVAPFSNSLNATMEQTVLENISLRREFGLRFSMEDQTYDVISSDNLDKVSDFSLANTGDESSGGLDASWTVLFETDGVLYTVTYRNFNFVFESKQETRFYFDPDVIVFDTTSGRILGDTIKILGINSLPDSGSALGVDYVAQLSSVFTSTDGYEDTTKVKVTYPDIDQDGIPDTIDIFSSVVAPSVNPTDKYVFFNAITDVDGYIRYEPVSTSNFVTQFATVAEIESNKVFYNNGQKFFATDEETFHLLTVSGLTRTISTITGYQFKVGRGDLKFQYRHNSPNDRRIDPSPNNIIDLYILTKTYDEDYRAWVKDSTNKIQKPKAPSSEELRTEFASLEQYKPISDSILFSPAKFKPLFGSKSDTSLKATFKVVKNATSTLSDSEVKSLLVTAMNRFFELENWDFGDTFYFSELSTYLHSELTPHVASIVLVPASTSQSFGSMYQVNCNADEIFISSATVDNIQIISAVTATQLNQI